MKFHRDMPALFLELVQTFALEALTVSKYRLALEALSRSSSGGKIAASRLLADTPD